MTRDTRKHLIISNKPFTTYDRQKAQDIIKRLRLRNIDNYHIEKVVHYLYDNKIKCSTGDGHASWNTVREGVNCPLCLQKMGTL